MMWGLPLVVLIAVTTMSASTQIISSVATISPKPWDFISDVKNFFLPQDSPPTAAPATISANTTASDTITTTTTTKTTSHNNITTSKNFLKTTNLSIDINQPGSDSSDFYASLEKFIAEKLGHEVPEEKPAAAESAEVGGPLVMRKQDMQLNLLCVLTPSYSGCG